MEYGAPSAPTGKRTGRIFAATAVLLAVALLLLILSVVQTRKPSSTLRQNGFLSPEDRADCYADAGNGLAAAGPRRLCLYSSSGKCVAQTEAAMDSPICVGSAQLGAYYDLGKPGLHTLYPDGSHRYTETDGAVSFADVNETGLITVLLEKSESQEIVMVYDADLTPLFRWDVGHGIPLIARTGGEDRLCVSTITREGSQLHFFRIDRTQELTELSFPGEILVDFDHLSDGTLAVVLESRIVFIDPDGQLLYSTDYSGHLEAWSLCGDFAAVATVSPAAGRGVLLSLASDGDILGQIPAPLHIGALAAQRDELLVLFDGGESTLYDPALQELVSYQPEEDVTQIFLTPNGMAFFAGASGVTLVEFGL